MKAEAIKPEFYDWDTIKVPEDGQIELPEEEAPVPMTMQEAYVGEPVYYEEGNYGQTHEPWA